MDCEICGAFSSDTRKVEIDGSVLFACPRCSKTGRELPNTQSNQQQQKPRVAVKQNFGPNTDFGADFTLIKNFGRVIKEAREKKNWTIDDLSQKLKERSSNMHRIESNSARPDDVLLGKIEQLLKINLREKIEKD
ncbi:MAG: multiprotein-bridging factor 1 family protein [Candidatus Diapherotrites archaeon]|nr:multiprotein-bridging factor 1 family protein [Candidatus Diapherotrites archaeon]